MSFHWSNKSIIALFIISLFFGCTEKEIEKDYVARVKDEYLTLDDIARAIDTSRAEKSYIVEYINNWVLREMFFQEAIKKNIVTEDEYLRIVQSSQKELANALLLKKIFLDGQYTFETTELEAYYNSKKNEFNLLNDAVLINSISFFDEDRAIQFRSTLLESDWNKTSLAFRGDTTIITEKPNLLLLEYEINPANLLRLIRELLPNEVSIVIETEPNTFTVVQIVEKYIKGEIPPFNAIRTEIEKRYLAEKHESLIKEYILSLKSKYDIEIKEINR